MSFVSECPLLIAELGTAHRGDLARGKELISAAIESGADCVKLQHVIAEEIIHPLTGLVPLPGGQTPLFEVFQELERGAGFIGMLKEYAEGLGTRFLCTPFGERSLAELLALGVTAIKIASPELNHLPLLTAAAKTGLPVYLSTGVSRTGDIEEALALLSGTKTTLLHCVTSYPAPPEEYNLKLISLYRSLFGLPVGLSDHSLDPLLVPLTSLLEGATVIEKHFTLARTGGGLDDPIALTPAEFDRMCREVRRAVSDSPSALREKLDSEYGRERIDRILGDGHKELAPSERENYGRSNRSIHALVEIPAGAEIRASQLALLRTEKELRPGLHPRYLDLLPGRRSRVTIPAGEGVRWSDIA